MDLRGNPGGLLDQAIKVSDVFVEDGTIVTTVRDERPAARAQAGAQRRRRARVPDGAS